MFRDLPHVASRALGDWHNIQVRERAEEEALDSQKRLADILSFLPDAVVAIDNGGQVIAWNHAMEQMTGVASEDMLGKGDHEYGLPFYGERRPILVDLVLENNLLTEKKYLYIQRDGQRITSEIFIPSLNRGEGAFLWGTASPLFDRKGNRIGAIEVIRDLTERKRNEELLRESEAALETLFNATHETIALLDRQGMIVNINEEGARRLGGSVGNITGKCAYDLLPPGIAIARKAHIDLVFETGNPVRFDDSRSGMCIRNEIYPIFNPEHTAVEHIAIFAADITDRKRAELALQESEARFKDLFTSMSSGAVIYEATADGEDFIIRDINHAVETIENVRKDEVIGKSVLEVFPGVRDFGLFGVFQRVAKTGIAESYRFRCTGTRRSKAGVRTMSIISRQEK